MQLCKGIRLGRACAKPEFPRCSDAGKTNAEAGHRGFRPCGCSHESLPEHRRLERGSLRQVGYPGKDNDWAGRGVPATTDTPEVQADFAGCKGGVDDLDGFPNILAGAGTTSTGYDLKILPITMNAKFERPHTGNLNAYFGGVPVSLDKDDDCLLEIGGRFNF